MWSTWGRKDWFGWKFSELFQSTVLGSLHSEPTLREGPVAEGACGRSCSPCSRQEAERRNTGWGRTQSSTDILPCDLLLPMSPYPLFSPPPNCTIVSEAHQGFDPLTRAQLSGCNHFPEDHEQHPSSWCMSLQESNHDTHLLLRTTACLFYTEYSI